MTQTPLAIAADYAEALLIARRAKGLLTLSLLLVLLTQLALFFLLRYYKPLPMDDSPMGHRYRELIEYFVGLLDIVGLFIPAILTVVLYLILKVQLVGRLLGVGRLTSAFLWSILLCLLLFPWQAVLNNPAINSDHTANALGMKIPGVLYTWVEISNPTVGARFGVAIPPTASQSMSMAPDFTVMLLHWARYVGFPILSVLILTIIHFKSDRGLQLSLGGENTVG